MKTSILLVFFFSLFITNAYSQGFGREDANINPSWEFYSTNTLSAVSSGMGNTGVAFTGNISSVVLNPASLDIKNNSQVYAGYTYKSSIEKNIYGMPEKIKHNLPSMVIGGVYKINKNFQSGFIYRNDYSYTLSIDHVSTETHPDADATMDFKYATHSFSVPLSFNYKCLRVGTDLNLTYYRFDSKSSPDLSELNAKADLFEFIPKIGFIITPIENFSFGATFVPGFTDSAEYKIEGSNYNSKSVVKYPNRIGVGTSLRLLNNKLLLALDYEYSGNSKLRFQKDMNNVNFGAEYEINNEWKIRGGFYTLLDFRADDSYVSYLDKLGDYDLYFITLGGTYKYKNNSFNLALNDSGLLSNSPMKSIKLTAGISLDF